MSTNRLGIAVVVAAVALPLIWLPAIAQGRDVIALFSQYLGMVSLILMALSQIIATRAFFVEPVFGGLDAGYWLHKWMGIAALVAMFLHDTIDAEMDGLGAETILVEVAETAGEISLYAILILVVITIVTFVPYHLWLWTHRFMGLFFAFAAFHYLFILKPFSNWDALGLYMGGICIAGIAAYLWTLMPGGLRRHRTYEVVSVEPQGRALAVSMRPKGNGKSRGRGIRHRPGQFAFVSFNAPRIDEPHPFTISSAPAEDGAIRMTIAALGDMTRRLPTSLQPGVSARIDGPYGRFGMPHGAAGQIWVAAGVGITPFVALAQALGEDDGAVTLFYTVGSRGDAAHLNELQAISGRKRNFDLVLRETQRDGRLTADAIAQHFNGILGDIHVLFCGPEAMRKALVTGLGTHGVPPRRIHYEEFRIRSGITIMGRTFF